MAICILASAFGLIVLYSMGIVFYSSNNLFVVQSLATVIGIVSALLISMVDYKTIVQFWKIIAPVAVILVLLTFFWGLKREGADDRAWLQLPGNLTFQPSELLKIAFIITFSLHLDRVKDNINEIPTLLLVLAHGAFPILLIHFQGDDGTALIFACIMIFMLFAAGLAWKYILITLLASPFIGAIMWFFIMGDHQKKRILVVFQPELDPLGDGYQALQGKIALGSGMMWGRGIFSKELKSIPEMQNDFIFAYIGQVLGFMGCMAVIVIMVAISIKILMVSRRSKDLVGTLLCVGVFSVFFFQVIINAGMSLSITPVIGITLPFFSSGGTSVTISYISIGLVLSVYRHNKKSMFEIDR